MDGLVGTGWYGRETTAIRTVIVASLCGHLILIICHVCTRHQRMSGSDTDGNAGLLCSSDEKEKGVPLG